MEFYKVIATISILFLIEGCGSVNKKDPYRPSGKSENKFANETTDQNQLSEDERRRFKEKKRRYEDRKRRRKILFLQRRYNLCTQKRALRSAKFEYNKLVTREKRYGNKLTKEKNRYKKIILEINSKRYKEEQKFKNTYKRPLQCTTKEMRYLNI